MFFILNHENSIIAADKNFLESIDVQDVYEATLLLRDKEVVIDEEASSILYLQQSNTFSKILLSTLFGDVTLYQLNAHIVSDDLESYKEAFHPVDIQEPSSQDNTLVDAVSDNEELSDEDILKLISEDELEIHSDADSTKETTVTVEEEIFSLSAEDKDDKELFDLAVLKEDPEEIETESVISEEINSVTEDPVNTLENDTSIISLLDEATAPSLDDTDMDDKETEEQPIEDEEDLSLTFKEDPQESFSETKDLIHTKEISELIGISENEYIQFLKEFKNESSNLDSDLRSNDLIKSKEAISTLKEASLLLHLPQFTEKLNELSNATSNEKENIIDRYFTLLSDIESIDTLPEFEEMQNEEVLTQVDDKDLEPPLIALAEEIEEEEQNEDILSILPLQEIEEIEEVVVKEIIESDTEENNLLDLDDIQAIPFDFSINEAADELTLPASLVSEFIVDFIDQAKENIPILSQAYKEGDLDKIQKTAHMLKGASSNLRITAIAETLYGLQFNDELSQVPDLIEQFAGQLKSLSLQMDQEQ